MRSILLSICFLGSVGATILAVCENHNSLYVGLFSVMCLLISRSIKEGVK